VAEGRAEVAKREAPVAVLVAGHSRQLHASNELQPVWCNRQPTWVSGQWIRLPNSSRIGFDRPKDLTSFGSCARYVAAAERLLCAVSHFSVSLNTRSLP
jgi:hypothetical protein